MLGRRGVTGGLFLTARAPLLAGALLVAAGGEAAASIVVTSGRDDRRKESKQVEGGRKAVRPPMELEAGAHGGGKFGRRS